MFVSYERIPVLDHIVNVTTGGFIQHKCASVALQQEHVDVAVVLGMLSVQVTRRLYECLCVSVFSDARIHLLHYVLGVLFYTAVALTTLLHLDNVEYAGKGCGRVWSLHSPHPSMYGEG